MILESQRGGQRNDFDIPAMKNGAVVDITAIVSRAFEKDVLAALRNSVKFLFSASIHGDSKFYTLDRNVPQSLYPDLAEFVRTGEQSVDLRKFIDQVIAVQTENIILRVREAKKSCLEFNPSDEIRYANMTALPVYAFLRRDNDRFLVETETSFRLFDPDPEVPQTAPSEN